jgi:phosphopentomutase
MSEPEVRVRWWLQDTMESGHWEVSGTMPLSQARQFGANMQSDYQIVQDEEGWPLFDFLESGQ